MTTISNSLMWFRKGLRIHDNPALEYAAKNSSNVYPVFVIDPHYMKPDPGAFSPGSRLAGVNRIRFLLESLVDLDSSLKKLGSRLLVFHGEPGDELIRCLKEWNIKRLCFEYDTDPYYQALGARVKNYASENGIEIFSPVSHTLFNPAHIIEKNGGKPPMNCQLILKLVGEPQWLSSPLSTTLDTIPPIGDVGNCDIIEVPTLKQLGYEDIQEDEPPIFRGGETEALRRLRESTSDKEWVAKFEKPKGDPSAFLKPATTMLSPYLKFGCLSSRYFYQCCKEIEKEFKNHTDPPVSLRAQLLWREFFYAVGFGTPNFDHMRGNAICRQIPWNDDDELLAAWRDSRTGFPWIDAIMVQLRKWGWIHHLARHSVACFLTRGDLFVHWEKGRDVFERLLVDSDWAINNGNWLWLSCSSFFYQIQIYLDTKYIVLSVISHDVASKECKRKIGAAYELNKKTNGMIQIYLDTKYIVLSVISHDVASKECKRKIGAAYELNKKTNGMVSDEDMQNLRRKLVEDQSEGTDSKRLKQKLI
ncbi:DNA photolyase family protein [Artemisia annua]|uniref:DNA photolyase family protein n=1 Tax=Artemisia annua TaxID=35608 RepID=A0A2U1KJU0_ARTAN|nr:DNA photolyase family protein [Artemisia annua]